MLRTIQYSFPSKADGLEISCLAVVPDLERNEKYRGIIQIVHGMSEYKERYIPFMEYMAERKYISVIHDHRGHGKSVRSKEDLGYMYGGGADAMLQGSCVIVGRAADYILKDYDNVVRIFIHAPQDYRIQRVMDVYGDTPKEARVNIERSDKARASYYEHISGTHWGDARNYELTVDSSDGVEKTAQFIVRYITGHTQTDSAV